MFCTTITGGGRDDRGRDRGKPLDVCALAWVDSGSTIVVLTHTHPVAKTDRGRDDRYGGGGRDRSRDRGRY